MVTETTEQTKNVASPGVANTALGLGIGALSLAVLQNGGLGGLLGTGAPRPPMPEVATQRDLQYERSLTEKDAKIGKLEAQQYADAAALAVERRLADKIEKVEVAMNGANATQAVINAQQTGVIGILQTQVANLNAMTGLYIRQPVMAASEAALAYAPGGAARAAVTGPTGN